MLVGKAHRPFGDFADDARKAISENPDYFVWWYTVKSVGLCAVATWLAYELGRKKGR